MPNDVSRISVSLTRSGGHCYSNPLRVPQDRCNWVYVLEARHNSDVSTKKAPDLKIDRNAGQISAEPRDRLSLTFLLSVSIVFIAVISITLTWILIEPSRFSIARFMT